MTLEDRVAAMEKEIADLKVQLEKRLETEQFVIFLERFRGSLRGEEPTDEESV